MHKGNILPTKNIATESVKTFRRLCRPYKGPNRKKKLESITILMKFLRSDIVPKKYEVETLHLQFSLKTAIISISIMAQ